MTYPFGQPAMAGIDFHKTPIRRPIAAASPHRPMPPGRQRHNFDFPLDFFWSAEPLCATGVHAPVSHRSELNAIQCLELANLLLTLPHH
jgi:hypothetical protein